MGKRGPKKGAKYKPTLAKEQAREVARVVITQHLERMLTPHIAHSMGIGHLYTREKNGKFKRIIGEEEAEHLLTEGTQGTDYWIFMKDPSTESLKELLNRALDRPKEQEQEFKVSGAVNVVAGLQNARNRKAAAQP